MDERNKAMQYAHVSIWGGGRGSQCSYASIWGGGSHAVFSRKYMGVGEASHVPCNILTQVYGGGGSEPCTMQYSHASIWGWGKRAMYHAIFSRKYMGVGEASHVPCNILTQVYGGGGSEPCTMQYSHASIWGWGKRAMYHAIFSRKYMGVGEASHVPCNILT